MVGGAGYLPFAVSRLENRGVSSKQGSNRRSQWLGKPRNARFCDQGNSCWGDFNLSEVGPTFTILAKHAKNKERKTLPVQSDLREMLVGYFKSCNSPGPSVKALKVPHRLNSFYRDLKAAEIPKVDQAF
jgi:hypothetical protein